MPEIDGLGIFARFGPTPPRMIVFATAYDHYTIQAFEAHALDYLLKPLDEDAFVAPFSVRVFVLTLKIYTVKISRRAYVAALEESRPATTKAIGSSSVRWQGRVFEVRRDRLGRSRQRTSEPSCPRRQ